MDLKRIRRLLESAAAHAPTDTGRSRVQDIQIHTHGYAEPGYQCGNEDGIIMLADWNAVKGWNPDTHNFDMQDNTMERLVKVLGDRYKIEPEWEDEWRACEHCQGLMRISPDSYGWTKCWYDLPCIGQVCESCILEHYMSEYLEHMEGNPKSAVSIELDLAEHGYEPINEQSFEVGLHPGQDADPQLIADGLTAHGFKRFIFELDSKGQFGLSFNVWIHSDEFDNPDALEATREWLAKGNWDGPSNSERLKKGLAAANEIAKSLPADSIKLLTVNADGTATGRVVTPEEFAAGV